MRQLAELDVDTEIAHLDYHPPYDWDTMLGFLAARCMRGVELVQGDAYSRTVTIGNHSGWIEVRHSPLKNSLAVSFSRSLSPALPELHTRLRDFFDLDAQPDLIAASLGTDALLGASIASRPGLRVPGAFDGFELACRAILGQQITVKAATTLSGRFSGSFGKQLQTRRPGLTHLAPTSEAVATASVDEIAALGVVAARAKALLALARAHHAGQLVLDSHSPPEETMLQLKTLPGIGPWTAGYIAMRALRWQDAFPHGDIAVLKKLGRVSARRADEMSRAWSPWRAYAVMHIWHAH